MESTLMISQLNSLERLSDRSVLPIAVGPTRDRTGLSMRDAAKSVKTQETMKLFHTLGPDPGNPGKICGLVVKTRAVSIVDYSFCQYGSYTRDGFQDFGIRLIDRDFFKLEDGEQHLFLGLIGR